MVRVCVLPRIHEYDAPARCYSRLCVFWRHVGCLFPISPPKNSSMPKFVDIEKGAGANGTHEKALAGKGAIKPAGDRVDRSNVSI